MRSAIMLALACLTRSGAARHSSRRAAFAPPPLQPRHRGRFCSASASSRLHSTTEREVVAEQQRDEEGDEDAEYIPPWSMPHLRDPSSKAFARFRQHVNPLARRYQMQTDLPEGWPASDFADVDLPLYLDIGCGKGGFLLELAGRRHGKAAAADDESEDGAAPRVNGDDYMNITKTMFEDGTDEWLPPRMNYLGLEIRPGVSQYAQARVEKRGLGGMLSFGEKPTFVRFVFASVCTTKKWNVSDCVANICEQWDATPTSTWEGC